MLYLPNLVAQNTKVGDPWTFTDFERIPEAIRKDKTRRTEWLQNPEADYWCYNMFEGQNSSLRINESNHAVLQYGAAGDYDVAASPEEIKASIKRMGNLAPNLVETTLSGHYRLLWEFERPWFLVSAVFAEFIQAHLGELLPLEQAVGLDRGALSPTRYLTNGGIWQRIHDKKVPWDLLLGWYLKMSNKYDWKNNEKGVAIDPKVAAERFRELKERFPQFSKWPGEFVLGSQGPSFFVPGSTSPTSAVVREKGMQTFAEHAHGKGFFLWSELLGAEWVKQFELSRIGNAVKDIYYDGQSFFVKSPHGTWNTENKDCLNNELVVTRGLTRTISKKQGQNHSEVEEALCFIRTHQRVKGAASFAFFDKGPIIFNGDSYLNLHTRDVLQPAASPAIWGAEGNMPWLSGYLEKFFDPYEQFDYFMSWLAIYYRSCYERKPRSGQSVFLAGAEGVGKTFLNREIVGRIVGGFAEAKDYLQGKDNFNSELWDFAHFVLDDGSIVTNRDFHRVFSEMIKKLSANREFRCNEKFRKATTVGWLGRLFVTCNVDAESIRQLPRMDISNRKKIMFFKAGPKRTEFFENDVIQAILTRELPYLCKFLLDWTVPEHCRTDDVRFGVAHYHEASLLRTAHQSSEMASFGEILDAFLKEFFLIHEPKAEFWIGTAVDLHRDILADPAMQSVLRDFSLDDIRRHLASLANSGQFEMELIEGSRRREYKIQRGEYVSCKKLGVGDVQNSEKFQKQ